MALFYAGTAFMFVVCTILAPQLASSPIGKLLAVLFVWVMFGLAVGGLLI